MNVLVAEHEMMCQSFLCNALSVRGLQPILAVNGERAWSILQERDAPRLAIIDFHLPAMNGIEICRSLRARHDAFYTYLLLLVPNSYRLDHLLALESGADDCLAKPFNQDELGVRLAIAGRILNIDDRLTEINGRWRTMLDTLPFGVATVDERGFLKRMNTTFARQMGFAHPVQLLGHSLDHVLQKQIDVHGVLDQISWAEPFDNVEVECRAPKLKSRTVRLWGRPLPRDGEAVYELIVQDAL
jgi:CheY-like chemotaxis protein